MKFEPLVPNVDVNIHPEPPGHWQHVAVVCRWKDAHAQRKQWPHAAVIGPLRTVRGLDELVRNLLHNPQIRVVLVVGSDLTEGEETTRELLSLWRGSRTDLVGEDVQETFTAWSGKIRLLCPEPGENCEYPEGSMHPKLSDTAKTIAQWRALAKFPDLPPPWTYETMELTKKLEKLVPSDYESERPKVTLPPPPPKAVVGGEGPHGDPGERVVADTLADLYPKVLHRAMRFGMKQKTQYGTTRELLCLTSVVRDVEESLRELDRTTWSCPAHDWSETQPRGHMHGSCPVCGGCLADSAGTPHPVLRLTWKQVEGYRDQVTGVVPPGDRPYSYGSRMRGRDLPHKPYRVASGLRDTDLDYKVLYDEDCCARTPSCLRSRDHEGPCDREEWWENEKNLKLFNLENDQITKMEKLLSESPGTRAAYLTPWRPMEDAGKESGRPCMVGGWFRVESGSLHLVVAFRSHDLYEGWPLNLAGILLWQCELAKKLGLRPGSLTCTSYSAHVYERDWTAAEQTIEEHYEKARHEPDWDQRSTWHVELVQPATVEKPVAVGETLRVPRSASDTVDTWEVQAEPVTDLYEHIWIENQTNGERRKVTLRDWRDKRGDYRGPQPKPTLRATALTPAGREVLRTFEAETPEALRDMCERSGLITSIGSALWLGDEIRKVAGRS